MRGPSSKRVAACTPRHCHTKLCVPHCAGRAMHRCCTGLCYIALLYSLHAQQQALTAWVGHASGVYFVHPMQCLPPQEAVCQPLHLHMATPDAFLPACPPAHRPRACLPVCLPARPPAAGRARPRARMPACPLACPAAATHDENSKEADGTDEGNTDSNEGVVLMHLRRCMHMPGAQQQHSTPR